MSAIAPHCSVQSMIDRSIDRCINLSFQQAVPFDKIFDSFIMQNLYNMNTINTAVSQLYIYHLLLLL